MNDLNQTFAQDNFTSRRTTGHNLYDPESLLTQDEENRGLTYYDKRAWPSEDLRRLAIEGQLPVMLIPTIAPRRKAQVAFAEYDYE